MRNAFREVGYRLLKIRRPGNKLALLLGDDEDDAEGDAAAGGSSKGP